MTIAFGDVDPEDAWDAADPLPVKLELLVRWVGSVLDERAGGASPRNTHRAHEARVEVEAMRMRRVELTTYQLAVVVILAAALDTVT